MTMRDIVAGEVRAQLARARISARQAAIRLGWSEPYISRRLMGTVPFDVGDLEALADLLRIPVTAFFERPAVVAEVQSGRIVRKSAFPAAVGLAAVA